MVRNGSSGIFDNRDAPETHSARVWGYGDTLLNPLIENNARPYARDKAEYAFQGLSKVSP